MTMRSSGVRSATRQYRKVERAIDAGYVQFFGCVHEPLTGSMGIHFVNGALAGDGAIDASTPEALMYEVKANGNLELVGAEYVVFKEAWDAANPEPPELFGQTFNFVDSPNRYGIPTVLRTARLGVEDQPDGSPRGLQPGGAVPRYRGPHALDPRTQAKPSWPILMESASRTFAAAEVLSARPTRSSA